MQNMSASKTAFRRVADESSRGRTGTVTVLCPKCRKLVRTVEVQVNGFNERSFKQEYGYDAVTGRSGYRYYRTDYNGRGCCY